MPGFGLTGRMKGPVIGTLLLAATPALACEVALMLAVDVSGSVDDREYRVQMDGLALALGDPVIADALIAAQAEVALMQWTGESRQAVVMPWRVIDSRADLVAMAEEIAVMPRRWRNFSTAIGEAMELALPYFDAVSHCHRRIMDISGDGPSNEGIEPFELWPALAERDVTVNALVIEESVPGLTTYFRQEVILGPGAFAVTAPTFNDYPEQIRRKLLRELTTPVAAAGPSAEGGSP